MLKQLNGAVGGNSFFQKMVLGQWDIRMQKNKSEPLPHTIQKLTQMDQQLKCKR